MFYKGVPEYVPEEIATVACDTLRKHFDFQLQGQDMKAAELSAARQEVNELLKRLEKSITESVSEAVDEFGGIVPPPL